MGTLYASPAGGEVIFEGRPVATLPLPVAVTRVGPGDVVQLTPARYTRAIRLDAGGRPGEPLTIRGAEGVVLDGQQPPTPASAEHMAPTEADFSFISLLSTDHVILERLAFERCWPSAVLARGCRALIVRDCACVGSQFFLYARNRSRAFLPDVLAHGITLERVRWIQDPEGRMWHGEISWKSVKGQGPKPHHTYLNGAFFGSFDIAGGVTMRDCTVSHAFNGIRMECRADPDLKRGCNVDVEIAGCRFDHIRDNAIEPEISARNWWIHHNELRNVHASYSLHNLGGGGLYLFGNQLWFDSKPTDISNTGGKVLKFVAGEPYPTQPINIFHNSCFIHSTYTKDGDTRLLKHFNNATEFCFTGEHCEPGREFFSDDETFFRWHASYDFRGDASNHPDFPDGFPPERGYAISGTRSPHLFRDGRGGDLRLRSDSAARGAAAAATIALPDGEHFKLQGGDDVGAWQENRLFLGPAFRPHPGGLGEA
jgi:hypothetical protein